MFYDILDKKRLEIMGHFSAFKDRFYLAGGTALALQIGHRDSIDFDFFGEKEFDTNKLFEELKNIFKDHKIEKIYEEKNTLTIILDSSVKISFFEYDYKLVGDAINEPSFRLASINDIACMKLNAIINRASNKDYIDIYYILQKVRLEEIIKKAEQKFPDIDINLLLKSLVFTKDVSIEPIMFKHEKNITLKKIQEFLKKEVRKAELERIRWA